MLKSTGGWTHMTDQERWFANAAKILEELELEGKVFVSEYMEIEADHIAGYHWERWSYEPIELQRYMTLVHNLSHRGGVIYPEFDSQLHAPKEGLQQSVELTIIHVTDAGEYTDQAWVEGVWDLETGEEVPYEEHHSISFKTSDMQNSIGGTNA